MMGQSIDNSGGEQRSKTNCKKGRGEVQSTIRLSPINSTPPTNTAMVTRNVHHLDRYLQLESQRNPSIETQINLLVEVALSAIVRHLVFLSQAFF